MSDLHRVGRFGLDNRRDHLRAAWGSVPLLTACGSFLSTLGRLGRRDSLHLNERRWSNMALSHLRVQLDLEGCEHIDPDERYVIIPLHEGFLDPVVLFQLDLGSLVYAAGFRPGVAAACTPGTD